MHTHLAL